MSLKWMKRFRGWFDLGFWRVRWRMHAIYGPYLEHVSGRKIAEVIGDAAWTEAPQIKRLGNFSGWDACMAAIEEDLRA